MVGSSSAYAAILRPRRSKARAWMGVGLDRIVVGRASPKRTLLRAGEVLQQGAEAVDGLAVIGAPADGLAARRRRDFGLGDGRGALGGRGFGIVVLEQHRGEVSLHVPDDVVGEHAQEDMGSDAMGPAMVDRTDVEVA